MSNLSIRTKLILAISILLAVTNVVLIASGAYLSSVETQITLQDTVKRLEQGLKTKGRALTANNSIVLRSLVGEYAFGAVEDLVIGTVKNDPDISYGIFSDAYEDVWVHAVSEGESVRLEINAPKVDQAFVEKEYKEVYLEGERVLEFLAPVTLDDEVSGWIRYGVSTASLQALQDEANTKLKIQLRTFILSLVIAGCIVAFFGFWVVRTIASQLALPIIALAKAAKQVAAGDYSQALESDTGGEIGDLADNFEIMRETVKKKIEDLAQATAVIQEQNRTLETKVEERTAALSEKTADMSNLLDNMPQGVFTVVQGSKIHPEYATHMHQLFQTKVIAGQEVCSLLFSNANVSAETVCSVETAIDSILGEDELMYDFNSHLLETQIDRRVDGQLQKLTLDWHPLLRGDVVEKLMVVVRDVTQELELKAQLETQQQDFQIIAQVIQAGQDPFGTFMSDAKAKLKAYSVQETFESETLSRFKMDLHTIKGSARTLGLTQMTTRVHDIETGIDADTMTPRAGLDEVSELVAHYDYVAVEKLKWSQGSAKIVSLEQLVAAQVVQLERVARDCEKPAPRLELDMVHVDLSPELASAVSTLLTHSMCNALVHGVEAPRDRLEAKKDPQGLISVRARYTAKGALAMVIKDDGKGLDLDRLWASSSAAAQGEIPRPSDQIIAETIFTGGISTQAQVSELAGRGVGLGAARQAIIDVGGSCTLQLLDPSTTGIGFELHIVFPLPAEQQSSHILKTPY